MIQNLLASPSASTHTPIQKKQPLLHKKAFIKGLSFSILILSAMASAAHQLETFFFFFTEASVACVFMSVQQHKAGEVVLLLMLVSSGP